MQPGLAIEVGSAAEAGAFSGVEAAISFNHARIGGFTTVEAAIDDARVRGFTTVEAAISADAAIDQRMALIIDSEIRAVAAL